MFLFFMGEAPFVSAAASLQTAPKLYHRRNPDSSLNRGASPSYYEKFNKLPDYQQNIQWRPEL